MIGALGAAFADDKPALGRATQTLVRLRAYETDIILAQIGLLEADEAAEARGQQSEAFQRTVTDLVAATAQESAGLRDRTTATSTAARGLLGTTSEVADRKSTRLNSSH